MRGFVFLDVLFASFLCIIALVLGMQLIANVVSSNHENSDALEFAALDVSNRLVRTCYDFGGVAYCDDNYIRAGIIDERVLLGYTYSEDILKYGESNKLKFRVGIDNDQKRGVVCIVRLLKAHGLSQEVRLQVCAE